MSLRSSSIVKNTPIKMCFLFYLFLRDGRRLLTRNTSSTKIKCYPSNRV